MTLFKPDEIFGIASVDGLVTAFTEHIQKILTKMAQINYRNPVRSGR